MGRTVDTAVAYRQTSGPRAVFPDLSKSRRPRRPARLSGFRVPSSLHRSPGPEAWDQARASTAANSPTLGGAAQVTKIPRWCLPRGASSNTDAVVRDLPARLRHREPDPMGGPRRAGRRTRHAAGSIDTAGTGGRSCRAGAARGRKPSACHSALNASAGAAAPSTPAGAALRAAAHAEPVAACPSAATVATGIAAAAAERAVAGHSVARRAIILVCHVPTLPIAPPTARPSSR